MKPSRRSAFRRAMGCCLLALAAGLAMPARAVTVVFSETFGIRDLDPAPYSCNPDFPAGWRRYNVDGLTPAPNDPGVQAGVPWVNDAWVVREDFPHDVTQCVAFSTSWYSPAGAADDWLVTPAIAVPAVNPKLSFRAVAVDNGFRDGYEVRWATTNSVAALLANPPLLTVAAENATWTSREIDLAALAGQTVYFAFRNNSNDMFLLALDDVQVLSIPRHDAKIESVLRPHADLLRLATIAGMPLQLGATVRNAGTNTITNATVTAHVKLDGNEIHSGSATAVPSLAANAGAAVTMAAYTVTQPGTVTVDYTLTIAETDEDPGNNAMSSAAILVTDLEQGRDDNNPVRTLGIGASTGGQLGTTYHLDQPAYVRAIRFHTAGSNTDLSGNPIVGEIRSINGTTGKPDALLATTQPYVVPSPPVAGFVDLLLASPQLLAAGDYYFGLIEPVHDAGQTDTLDLGVAAGFYQPGRNWVRFASGAPDWATMESFGTTWQVAPMLRVLYARVADLSLSKVAPATVVAGAAFSYTLQASNAGPDAATNLVATDPLPSGAGFVSAGGTGWTCAANAGTLTCSRATLAVGAAPAITVNLTAPNAVATLSTTASVSGDTVDPDGTATATASTTVLYGTPSAFAFLDETGVARSTQITSAPVQIAGINTTANWTVTGSGEACASSTNSCACDVSAWGVSGSVDNGQHLCARHDSSASFATTTNTVVTVGAVADTFSSTTLAPVTTYTGPTGTGTASVVLSGGNCGFTTSRFVPLSSLPMPPPADLVFPQDLFDFILGGCTPGGTVTVTITYPQVLPHGSQYWKFGPTASNAAPHWYVLPATIAGNTATFSIVDGGLGDDDLDADGVIVDQGGPAVVPLAVPVWSPWSYFLMSLLLVLSGFTFTYRHRRP